MPRVTDVRNKPPAGVLIAEALKKRNKTQRWLAESIDITHEYLWQIISGKAIPSIRLVKKISVALKLNFFDLVHAFYEVE